MNKWIRKCIYYVEKEGKRRHERRFTKTNIFLVFAAFLKHQISLVVVGMWKDDGHKRGKISSTSEYSRVLPHLDQRVHENDLEKRWKDMTCMWAIVIVIVVWYAAQTLNAPKMCFILVLFCVRGCESASLFCYYFSHFRDFGRVLRFFFSDLL